MTICIACIACKSAIGQTGMIDSLRTRLRTEGPTAARVDLLIALSMQTYSAEQDTASMTPLREAITLSRSLNYPVGLAYAPCLDAMRAYAAQDYPASIEAMKRSIILLDALHVVQGRCSPLWYIRNSYNAAGLQDERVAYYQAALERYTRSGPKQNMADCYHGIGGYYLVSGQYALAIENYLKAREIFNGFDRAGAANEVSVVGRCYAYWGNTVRAEPYLLDARESFVQLKDSFNVMEMELELARMEVLRGDTLPAIRRLRSAAVLCMRTSALQVAICHTRLAILYVRTGKMDSARVEVDSANAIAARTYVPLSSANQNCEVDFCNYLYQKAIGEQAEADRYLHQALAAALVLNDVALTMKYRLELSKRYQESGDDRNAMVQLMAYTQLNDSLEGMANKSALAAYESTMKERQSALEIEQQQASIKQQRIVLFSTGGGLLLVLALGFSIYRGKKRSDELLLNILPKEVAKELKAKGSTEAELIEHVTVLFTDFKGFTAMSEQLSPKELVRDIHECFSAFDGICGKYGIEKIKTIGDAYMAAGGLPTPNSTHATDVVRAALEMRDFIAEGKALKVAAGLPYFEIRIGVHTGPVVAGIVGVKKFQYDIWGDTVNTASRMESSGEVGQVNISEATYVLVREVREVKELREVKEVREVREVRDEHNAQRATRQHVTHQPATRPAFIFTRRGKVQAKGKGEMEMYFVERNGHGKAA
ncbi:MAG: adenylate/guanylate cyclase domain-containing protein [Flavobacteriales bacterium]